MRQFNPSAPSSSTGNPFDEDLEVVTDDFGEPVVDDSGEPIFIIKASEFDKIAAAIRQQNAQIELLEKQSALEKRLGKYKSFDPAETWCSHWVVYPIACLLTAKEREEWLGDLLELHREMLHKGYSRWFVNFIDIGQAITRLASVLQIKLADFISSSIRRGS